MLQVASCWQSVSSVLTDDFLGIGTDQMLVFPKTGSISEKLTSFQIIDFGKHNYKVRCVHQFWGNALGKEVY